MTQATYSPDPPSLGAGAGTAAAQSARPRMYADPVNGGWDQMATGATAGTPGTFTPAGAKVPANLAGMTGVTASPATAWTTGQYVSTADAAKQHWSGTAWVTGVAVVAEEARTRAKP